MKTNPEHNINFEGYYEITFNLGDTKCPTRWDITDSSVVIINAEERIQTTNLIINKDSGSFTLPVFGTTVEFFFDDNSSLHGTFKNQFRPGNYIVPFKGYKKQRPSTLPIDKSITYAVNMDPSQDPYKAIGIFNFQKEKITGTFLTETGDYRYLEGSKTSESEFYLSCFDGSHLFYFSAEMDGDSISGEFLSGNHWSTTWNGIVDPDISLLNPDSLTFLNHGETYVEFSGVDSNKDSLVFNSMNFDQVTIVQILGTWCPNCMDETRYYNQLINKYEDQIDIIGLAFERPGDLSVRLENIQTYKSELNVSYPIYLSGNSTKTEAANMFSSLNNITSFPTTIFFDKHGIVRKIHTGFYGPGTGEYYSKYTHSTEQFLENLIAED